MRTTLPLGGHHLYDRLVTPPIQQAYMAWAQRHGGSGRGLDIGCGPGHLAAGYARLHGAQVVGLDLDRAQLRIAARHHPDLPLVQGDASRLPYPDGAFETAWTTESYHHWPDPLAGLAEAHRVLAPGGRLWIIEGCGDITAKELAHWMRPWFLPIARGVFARHGYTPKRLVREVLKVVDASPFPKRKVHRHWGWWWVECIKD